MFSLPGQHHLVLQSRDLCKRKGHLLWVMYNNYFWPRIKKGSLQPKTESQVSIWMCMCTRGTHTHARTHTHLSTDP